MIREHSQALEAVLLKENFSTLLILGRESIRLLTLAGITKLLHTPSTLCDFIHESRGNLKSIPKDRFFRKFFKMLLLSFLPEIRREERNISFIFRFVRDV